MQVLTLVRCLAQSRAVISNKLYLGGLSVNKNDSKLVENVFLLGESKMCGQRLFLDHMMGLKM